MPSKTRGRSANRNNAANDVMNPEHVIKVTLTAILAYTLIIGIVLVSILVETALILGNVNYTFAAAPVAIATANNPYIAATMALKLPVTQLTTGQSLSFGQFKVSLVSVGKAVNGISPATVAVYYDGGVPSNSALKQGVGKAFKGGSFTLTILLNSSVYNKNTPTLSTAKLAISAAQSPGTQVALGLLATNAINKLPDATFVGKVTGFNTINPNLICFDGKTINVWTAPKEYPNQYIVYNNVSLSCGQVTLSTNPQNSTLPPSPPVILPAGTTWIANVPYCTIGGTTFSLDVYIPANTTTGMQRPIVVYIHGGGWTQGDAEHGSQLSDIPVLVSNGFDVASLTYGLAPAYPMPDAIIDSMCAIRFLRANAAQYNINPNEIGVYGDSAGGNIDSLLIVQQSQQPSWYAQGQWQGVSGSVQAIVDMFGPSNITDAIYPTAWGPVFSGSTAIGYNSSPVNYVRPGEPPILIQQGVLDTTVPENQSIEFYNLLIQNGDTATLTLVQNSGHEFTDVGDGPLSPSIPQLQAARIAFFKQYLGLNQPT